MKLTFGKPHLFMRRGVWCCRCFGPLWPIGHGYTPEEAFKDWEAQR